MKISKPVGLNIKEYLLKQLPRAKAAWCPIVRMERVFVREILCKPYVLPAEHTLT